MGCWGIGLVEMGVTFHVVVEVCMPALSINDVLFSA